MTLPQLYQAGLLLFNWYYYALPSRRVHVSERTLGFLKEEFEVEAGHGEKREEILKIAGIKTYFIVRARKPVSLTKIYHVSPPIRLS